VIIGFFVGGRMISFTGLLFSKGEEGGSGFFTTGVGTGFGFGGGGLTTFFSGFF
jgi:hypothetical protein|tara:strand:- start:225 stop:386 length:162 start_codon:yes stop_codon:yes gene_type:complete